jgi:hypothetical protein
LRWFAIEQVRHCERSEAIFCKYPRRRLGLASMLKQRRLRSTYGTGLVESLLRQFASSLHSSQ